MNLCQMQEKRILNDINEIWYQNIKAFNRIN